MISFQLDQYYNSRLFKKSMLTQTSNDSMISIHSQSYEKYIAYLDYKLGLHKNLLLTPYLLIVCLVPGCFLSVIILPHYQLHPHRGEQVVPTALAVKKKTRHCFNQNRIIEFNSSRIDKDGSLISVGWGEGFKWLFCRPTQMFLTQFT